MLLNLVNKFYCFANKNLFRKQVAVISDRNKMCTICGWIHCIYSFWCQQRIKPVHMMTRSNPNQWPEVYFAASFSATYSNRYTATKQQSNHSNMTTFGGCLLFSSAGLLLSILVLVLGIVEPVLPQVVYRVDPLGKYLHPFS